MSKIFQTSEKLYLSAKNPNKFLEYSCTFDFFRRGGGLVQWPLQNFPLYVTNLWKNEMIFIKIFNKIIRFRYSVVLHLLVNGLPIGMRSSCCCTCYRCTTVLQKIDKIPKTRYYIVCCPQNIFKFTSYLLFIAENINMKFCSF